MGLLRAVCISVLGFGLALAPVPGAAAEVVPPPGFDIYVLGEVHDNPAHHAEQARLVALIAPATVVWEMLLPAQVQALQGVDRTDRQAMETALGWAESGWPDFAMYHPVFLAAGGAGHVAGGVPREQVRQVMAAGLDAVLGPAVREEWGLGPLPPEREAALEAEQAAAHCDALPAGMLPAMVEAQRLRDWTLASRAVAAVEAGKGPVVVITGTGHARKDEGVPALVAAARPGMKVWSLGQVEPGPGQGPAADRDPGLFDAVNTAPPPLRDDPCAVFRKG